jgi:UDP-N-acetylglucosamine diphosphorylase/glucosamine-1-phosphate N-acetyltransferase
MTAFALRACVFPQALFLYLQVDETFHPRAVPRDRAQPYWIAAMKKIVLFEDEGFSDLLPLVYWRSVFELRLDRRILLDRAAQMLGVPVSGVWTRDWIAKVAQQRCGTPANTGVDDSTVLVNGRWLTDGPVEWPKGPCVGVVGDEVVYIVCDAALASDLAPRDLLEPARRTEALESVPTEAAPGRMLRYPWEIVSNLHDALEGNWRDSDAGIEIDLDRRVTLECEDRIHIGQRARVHATAVISAESGAVYLSEGVTIGPHAVIEGPVHIAPNSVINPHAWVHGANSIGPLCKIGGEVHGCVIQGHTNKQHDGFLGHSYVGSWVNLGAGTVNSDLKNTYGNVRVPINGRDVDTGQTFFGAVIGDFVKTAINTTIPTGAVIGAAAVVATSSILPKFVPSFAWLTDKGIAQGDPGRLLDLATVVMARRNVDMTDAEVELFLDLPIRTEAFEQESTTPA